MSITTTRVILWPPEGVAEFISEDGGTTWTPLCSECGSVQVYTVSTFTGTGSWECLTMPFSHRRRILWAEDWPNYDMYPEGK